MRNQTDLHTALVQSSTVHTMVTFNDALQQEALRKSGHPLLSMPLVSHVSCIVVHVPSVTSTPVSVQQAHPNLPAPREAAAVLCTLYVPFDTIRLGSLLLKHGSQREGERNNASLAAECRYCHPTSAPKSCMHTTLQT